MYSGNTYIFLFFKYGGKWKLFVFCQCLMMLLMMFWPCQKLCCACGLELNGKCGYNFVAVICVGACQLYLLYIMCSGSSSNIHTGIYICTGIAMHMHRCIHMYVYACAVACAIVAAWENMPLAANMLIHSIFCVEG